MATILDLSLTGASVANASTERIGDPDGDRTIVSIVVLLVALGAALTLVAVWLYKTTRPDPELLAPLEVMGDRAWRRGDPVWQRRRLDEVRPGGAQPLEPSAAPPSIDAAFDRGPQGSGFEDLHADAEPAGGDDELLSEAEARVAAATPPGTERPALDELPEGEVDPEVLATAMAQLDAELGGPTTRAPSPAPAEQFDAAEVDGDVDGDVGPDSVDVGDEVGDDAGDVGDVDEPETFDEADETDEGDGVDVLDEPETDDGPDAVVDSDADDLAQLGETPTRAE